MNSYGFLINNVWDFGGLGFNSHEFILFPYKQCLGLWRFRV